MLLAIISDIHSDLPSLEKAMESIGRLECDRIICLGDIVGYSYHYADVLDGRDPDACCEIIREQCHIVICGNHDLHALKKLPSDYKRLGMPLNWYDLKLDDRATMSANRFWLYDDELEHTLNPSSRHYLSTLPESYVAGSENFSILCTHYIAPDVMGVTKGNPASRKEYGKHFRLLKRKKCLVGIAGHAHPEGYVQVSGKYFRMNYFGKGNLLKEKQVILSPAITRGGGRNGFLLLDTQKKEFEAIPLD